jgi:hypothetical protein
MDNFNFNYGELVAHLSDYPPVRVIACCDPKHGKAKEDIFEQPNVPNVITCPPHLPAVAVSYDLALLSTRDCAEPKSYRDALSIAQAHDWQSAMQHENTSLMDNGTWELVDLPPDRVVVNNIWIYI